MSHQSLIRYEDNESILHSDGYIPHLLLCDTSQGAGGEGGEEGEEGEIQQEGGHRGDGQVEQVERSQAENILLPVGSQTLQISLQRTLM